MGTQRGRKFQTKQSPDARTHTGLVITCAFYFLFCKSSGLGGLGVVNCGTGGATGRCGVRPSRVCFLPGGVCWSPWWGLQVAAGEAELRGTANLPTRLFGASAPLPFLMNRLREPALLRRENGALAPRWGKHVGHSFVLKTTQPRTVRGWLRERRPPPLTSALVPDPGTWLCRSPAA